MTSRERILAAVNFQPVDRPPFDFFEEAGYLFENGRYDPSRRLLLTYEEQVEARLEFHKKFQTDLIFDVPVLIPSKIPYNVRLYHNNHEIIPPFPAVSSVSALAWNAMPPKVKGSKLLEAQAKGQVIKKVAWDNGVSSEEFLDLATGTADSLRCPFGSAEEILQNIDCLGGNLAQADYSFLQTMRRKVSEDVMLSGTVTDPFSSIGWYIGLEKMMYLPYDDEKNVLRLCEKLTEICIATSCDMVRHGMDMIRLGAATACLLSPDLYRKFCLPFQKAIIEAVQQAGALVQLHLCGNIGQLLPILPETKAAILETITPPPLADTTLAKAKAIVGHSMCLKGNLNPNGALKNGTPQEALAEARECISAGSPGSGFIFSVADNLALGTPEENIKIIADYIIGLAHAS